MRYITPNLSMYDRLIGESNREPMVVAGEQALARAGLTTLFFPRLQLYSLYPTNPVRTPYVTYYFNPMADQLFLTKPSSKSKYILVPTKERALIDYILFKDYFNEGILIEGLKTYMFQKDDDVSALYEVGQKYYYDFLYKKVIKGQLDYWIKEAKEEWDDP